MMEAMRQSWTDERLDDFRADVNRQFNAVDRRFDAVDRRFEQVEGKVDGLRVEMKEGFDSLHRLMVQFSSVLIVSLIAALVAPHL